MIALLAPLLAVASLIQAEPAPDQTSDALIVAGLLQALRTGDDDGVSAALAETARLDGPAGSGPAALEGFATYARDCQLRHIKLLNSRNQTRMPVTVEWQCRYPQADRNASFWVEEDQIRRISWGPLPTVDLPESTPPQRP
jgi:hypothetical protein